MALDQDQLQQDVLAAIKAAAASSTPDDAQTTLASKLAQAIQTYVSAAAVRNVQVDITTGAQSQDGVLQ